MPNNRNPKLAPLRKLILSGSMLAEKARAKGDPESIALADIWQKLLEQSRQKNLLRGATSQ